MLWLSYECFSILSDVFCQNTKNRSSAFRKFLFYQNITLFDWVMNLFLPWVMFSVKIVSFPARAAVTTSYLMYSSCKISQKTIEIPVFLCFLHNIVQNLVQIFPHRPHPLYFFLADFQWNYAFPEITAPSCKWGKTVTL